MKSVRSHFITGFLVLVPVLATIDIASWFVDIVDRTARKYIPTELLPFDFIGLGLIIALVVVFVMGVLANNFIGKWLIEQVDIVLRKFPIFGGVYGSIQQFLETVFGSGQDKFNEAVLVEFPREGIYSIGFRTGVPDSKLLEHTKKKLVNVFVPCTPNPTSGFYILVPADKVSPLEMSVQEAFKIVISMGVVTTDPKKLKK